jgi:uncharacterized repeat protein (TIGR01451 family)
VISAAATVAAAMLFTGCTTTKPDDNTVTVQPVDNSAEPKQAVQPASSVSNGIAKGTLAFPTGDPATSALLLEKSMPVEVVAGKPFAYEVKVTNLSKNKLEGVEVTEMLPASLKLSDLSSGSSVKDGTARHLLGALAPGESKTLKVTATAGAAGSLNSCATVNYNTSLCMGTSVVQPALKLTKSLPSEVLVCDPIQAKYVITNTGSGPAKSIKIEDVLPSGLTTADGKANISIDAGTLNAGETREVTFNLKASKPGEFASKAIAKAEDGVTSDSGDVKLVVRQPKLEVKFDGPEKEFIGRPFSYNVTVTNTGDGAAKDSVVIATLPQGAKFEKAGESGVPIDASHVQWSLGELAPKESKKLSLAVSGAQAGTIKNTIAAQARCAETVLVAKETSLTGISAVLVEAIDVSDPLEVGQNQTYIITVTNQGSAPTTNVKLICTLEDQMEFVSATGQTNGKSEGKTVTFEPMASLGAKGKAVWQVVVKAKDAGDVRFKINVTTDQLTRPVEETEASNFYK